MMAQFTQGLDSVVFAERGAARLEERLGREHQDPKWPYRQQTND